MGKMSLRMKIFLSMIFLVLGASVLFVVVTLYEYRTVAIEYHNQQLTQKENAVRASINYQLRQTYYEVTTENLPLIFKDKIYEIQDVHDLEVVLYDLNGNLLKSSKAAFFEEPDAKISANILQNLKNAANKRYVEHYTKDDVDYQSSYTFITDNYFKPLAILNLPAIEDEDYIASKLKDFLMRLGQVYLFMIVISILLSYFLSKQITGSLQSISEKIKATRFDASNKKIAIRNAGEEIATVVKAYNSMIDQLEDSAAALAASERESAWREMAKQVAHEIKNPLTPMRLTVQSFEHKFDKDDPQIHKKVKEFSKTMIQQIDTMSAIASAFSTYAKMPAQKDETLDVVKITKLALDIFNEDYIRFTPPNTEGLRIKMDRAQLVRIVTNLVKNAVQAVEETENPAIDVAIESSQENVLLLVSDNGKGIAQDHKDKVFEPKFTTKSSGMGLGLAMVKNIVESYRGTISFTSQTGKGTVFRVEFPIFVETNHD